MSTKDLESFTPAVAGRQDAVLSSQALDLLKTGLVPAYGKDLKNPVDLPSFSLVGTDHSPIQNIYNPEFQKKAPPEANHLDYPSMNLDKDGNIVGLNFKGDYYSKVDGTWKDSKGNPADFSQASINPKNGDLTLTRSDGSMRIITPDNQDFTGEKLANGTTVIKDASGHTTELDMADGRFRQISYNGDKLQAIDLEDGSKITFDRNGKASMNGRPIDGNVRFDPATNSVIIDDQSKGTETTYASNGSKTERPWSLEVVQMPKPSYLM